MLNLSDEQLRKLQTALQLNAEKNARKLHDEFDKTLDVVVDKLALYGWTLPTELNIYAVNVIGQTNDIEDINKFLLWFFSDNNYDNTKHMIDGILSANISEGLKRLTNECWEAFQYNLFAVCANSLLSVIEGVLSEFSDNKSDTRMMQVCQKHVDMPWEDGKSIDKHIWISYNKFIRNLYKKSDFNSNEPNILNRHWFLHGRSNYDVNELDCIRLFNSVSSLCTIIGKAISSQTLT